MSEDGRAYEADPRSPNGLWLMLTGRYWRRKYDAPAWFVLVYHVARIVAVALILKYCGLALGAE